MTEDVWNALSKTTAAVERLIDAVDGPAYIRVDGSIGRQHSAGLLGQVEGANRQIVDLTDQVTELNEQMRVYAATPTKISVPRWWTPIAVAAVTGLFALLAVVIQTLRAVT